MQSFITRPPMDAETRAIYDQSNADWLWRADVPPAPEPVSEWADAHAIMERCLSDGRNCGPEHPECP